MHGSALEGVNSMMLASAHLVRLEDSIKIGTCTFISIVCTLVSIVLNFLQ